LLPVGAVIVAAGLLLGALPSAHAQCDPEEFAKLLASDGAGFDEFGYSAALSGDVAVIGAPLDDDYGSCSGSAYIYRFDGVEWCQEQKLLAADGRPDDRFGGSVAISGNTVVVGADWHDGGFTNSGAAYVYRFDGATWVQEQKLLPSDAAQYDCFGRVVAISGDTVIVGTPYADDCGSSSGAAYVFRFDGAQWNEEVELLAWDGAPHDEFGSSVAISGNTAVVGAAQDDDKGYQSGAAYVYRFDGTAWLFEQKLVASDGSADDVFGSSVVARGDVIVVGAPEHAHSSADAGAVYVYRFDGLTWVEEQELLASDGLLGDKLGASVAIGPGADLVAAGAPGVDGDSDSDYLLSIGAVYLYAFDGTGWNDEHKLLASDASGHDFFGCAVAAGEDTALVGARCVDDNGPDAGVAYVFDLTAPIITQQPSNQTAHAGDGASFTVTATALGTLSYQWRKDGVDLADGGNVSGATTDTLTIDPVGVGDAGDYDVLVSDDVCGRAISDAATLLVTLCYPEELAKLLASDGAPGDEFGNSLSVSGDVAIVGAPRDDENGTDAGAAYIYRFDGVTWHEEQKLLAPDGAAGDKFGNSVAISHGAAVIGAVGDDDNGTSAGSAYVYRFDGTQWVQEQKLLPWFVVRFDWFGAAVAIDTDVLVVGAPGRDVSGPVSGAAYVYRFDGTTWVREQTLVASDAGWSDNFGRSVSISGDVALVGAYLADDAYECSGAAYVYRFDGAHWPEEQKLRPWDGGQVEARFGCSVAVSADAAIVGAYQHNHAAGNSGVAYVYRFDGSAWKGEQKLAASDGAAYDRLGAAVTVDGNVAVVGAPLDDDGGDASGSAYVYRFDGITWNQQAKLLAWDGAPGDQFAYSVAVNGNVAIVGADADDDNGDDSGSAYVFGIATCQGDLDGDCDTDQADLGILLADWGCTGGDCPGDCDFDGDTDHSDLGILLAHWGCDR